MSDDLQPIAPEAALELYLDQRKSELRPKTYRSHRYRLEPFVEWCKEQDHENMNDITGRDLHEFRVWRSENGDLKPVSLHGNLSTLRVFLEFYESIDAIREDLRSKVLLPSVSEEEMASKTNLDQEFAEEILGYLDRYQYASRKHVILALLWRTGMQSGSLRTLDLDDYF